MALTQAQAVIWKQITHAYDQWNPNWDSLMPVSVLTESLPTVAPEMIGDTLAQAASEHLAEVESISEEPGFRPVRH